VVGVRVSSLVDGDLLGHEEVVNRGLAGLVGLALLGLEAVGVRVVLLEAFDDFVLLTRGLDTTLLEVCLEIRDLKSRIIGHSAIAATAIAIAATVIATTVIAVVGILAVGVVCVILGLPEVVVQLVRLDVDLENTVLADHTVRFLVEPAHLLTCLVVEFAVTLTDGALSEGNLRCLLTEGAERQVLSVDFAEAVIVNARLPALDGDSVVVLRGAETALGGPDGDTSRALSRRGHCDWLMCCCIWRVV